MVTVSGVIRMIVGSASGQAMVDLVRDLASDGGRRHGLDCAKSHSTFFVVGLLSPKLILGLDEWFSDRISVPTGCRILLCAIRLGNGQRFSVDVNKVW